MNEPSSILEEKELMEAINFFKKIIDKNNLKTEHIVKRWIKKPDYNTLSDNQKTAYDSLESFINSETENRLLLSGSAGSGKTYLISLFIEHLLYNKFKGSIGVTAPTNKAVSVLNDMAKYKDDNLVYNTIHSLLGLKPKIDPKTGKEEFLEDFDTVPKIGEVNLLFLDEASQLSEYIFGLLAKYDVKIIFVGDIKQLPPVGEDLSMVFKSVHTVELKGIIRQAEDNYIIQFSNEIAKGRVLTASKLKPNGEGIYRTRPHTDEFIKLFYKSENYANDPDFVRIVAWTNKSVMRYNKIVRKFLYGDVGKLVVGERLIVDKPVMDGKMVLLSTNKEIFVKSFREHTENILGEFLKFYITVVEDLYNKEYEIKIIHEDSEKDLSNILKGLSALAKKETNKRQRGARWSLFWDIKKFFAEVKYAYSVTIHKSQGSTFQNTFVAMEEINSCPNQKLRKQLAYTAVTRAAKTVFLI